MSITDLSVNFYRKTIKRFRPVHMATHWLMNHGTIPLLEKTSGFHTMPDDPFWFRLELLTNRHEPETMACLDSLVRPGMTMLDVGAHVGYYTSRYAKTVGEDGRIYAFEPHPRTFATLCHNVKQQQNVVPVQVALAETAGTAELHDYLMMSASGSLNYDESMVALQQAQLGDQDVAPRIGAEFTPQTFTVQTLPADTYLAQQGVNQVDIIKMDIEGAELNALRGLRQTINQSPRLWLVMEYNPAALSAFHHQPLTALEEVLALGFDTVETIEPDGRLVNLTAKKERLVTLTDNLLTHMGVINLLFTRNPEERN